ncbi:unnamed protein product [Cunninghamella blakesleeana]
MEIIKLKTWLSWVTSHLSALGSSLDDENGRFGFFKKLKNDKLSNLRSLGNFFDKNRIQFTSSFPTITRRWNHNLSYFSGNYLLIIIALSIYAIITNWWLLFTVAFLVGGFYLITRYEGPFEILGTTVNTSSLYTCYVAGSLLLLLFSGATGAVFWVIGAGALLILTHAAIIEPSIETEFADGQV